MDKEDMVELLMVARMKKWQEMDREDLIEALYDAVKMDLSALSKEQVQTILNLEGLK